MNHNRRTGDAAAFNLPRFCKFPLAQVQTLERRTLFNSVAHFETSEGNFDVELFDSVKPLSVENFIQITSASLYNNSIIHRSSPLGGNTSGPNQFIEGGGYVAKSGLPEIKDKLPAVPDELNTNGLISNVAGTFTYAKTGPNTAKTQWFVNLADNSGDLDTSQNIGGYTVFGQVTPDTVAIPNAIGALTTTNLDPSGNVTTNPFTNVPVNNNNAVVVTKVSFSQLDLKLGAGGAKTISFVDADGTKSSISLSGGGSATVHVIGDGMERISGHGNYTLTGKVSSVSDLSITGSTSKSKLSISGKKGNGSFSMGGIAANGPLKSLSLGGVSLGGPITVGGDLGSLSMSESLLVNVSATSIGGLSVKGDISGSTIALSANLGKTSVSGSIVNSFINAATTISSVSAKALSGSEVYAGANLPGGGLPAAAADLTNQQASIGSVSVKSTANSDVVSFTLGKISLGSIALNNNGTAFGVGAHTISSLSGTGVPGGKFSLKKLTDSVVVQQELMAKGIQLIDAKIIIV